jgi:hypothetical protein
MSYTKDQLLDLKEKIDTTKTTISEYTGQLQSLMKSLEKDFRCITLEEAKIKLTSLKKNIGILENKISAGSIELEKQFNEEE